MNYGSNSTNAGSNKRNPQVVTGGFAGLKNQLAGNLTAEKPQEYKVLSQELKRMLAKLGVHQVEVIKNKLDHIQVDINGQNRSIPIKDNIIGGMVFVQKEPRGFRYHIMKNGDVTESIHFAKGLLEREGIVNEGYGKSVGAISREDKTLFNNLIQGYYTSSNKSTHFNTVIEGERLIGKIEGFKELNDHEILVTVRFNKNFFGKIRRDKEAAWGYGGDARDLYFKEGDYCFVQVNRLREEEKNGIIVRNVDLKYYY